MEGAVANLLFHMNMIDDAAQFKMLSVMSDSMIRVAMDVDKIPKNVLTNRDGMDPIEKSMWILEKKFNCRRSLYLNPVHFRTSEMMYMHLRRIKFPVIISVLGQMSSYNHVVVVWKNMIIDFENEMTYALSIEGIDKIAGVKNRFHKLVR